MGGDATVRAAPLPDDGADGGTTGLDGVAFGTPDLRGGRGGGRGKEGGLGGTVGPELDAPGGTSPGSNADFCDGSSAMVACDT
jgi:hypothetical protein